MVEVVIADGPHGVRMVCRGTIDSPASIEVAQDGLADPRLRAAQHVTVSWTGLAFISSRGIKAFASWLGVAVDDPEFRVHFEVGTLPAQAWQRRTVAGLAGLVGDALTVGTV